MNNESVVISNRIRLARNLSNMPFPSKLDDTLAKRVEERVTSSIKESNSYISKDFELIKINEIKAYDRLSLVEKHLISKELLNSNKGAALINRDETVSIMINEEDHIRLQVINKGFDIEKSFDLANKIDDLIEESLTYAYDPQYGYLTSCPSNIGTGLRASMMLHLPALSKNGLIQKLSNSIGSFGMTIRGLYGEGSEGFGNMYQVSNQVSLGVSEKDIIEAITNVTNKIIKDEIKARQALISKGKVEFEDSIFRSLGILKYGKLFSAIDALNLLSNVRCGVEMGIINDIELKDINNAIETIQSGNIQRISSKEMTPRERDIERGKILNKLFK
ncbi:protein arginine kinase [Clostridium cylindrosporum]|uniref:Protein-arginine kinase n=1 Tax=Clostridium cylindrosporum DSM 605 TaxID=1121307 RepID=A0A0J8DDX7_CLOCY|nr:protein arginine kinase [Clostridium cylindrosporum]KMT22434.1 putative ATP:guanido phosphotransferase [Clostridium cylindrosporum DSM 605]